MAPDWQRASQGIRLSVAVAFLGVAPAACTNDHVPLPQRTPPADGGAEGGFGGSAAIGSGGAGGAGIGGGGAGDGGSGCTGTGEVSGPQGQCYWYDPGKTQWPLALAACRTWGGTLAALSSKSEWDLVQAEPTIADDFWIGLQNPPLVQGEDYTWLNGEVFDPAWTPLPWKPNEPNDPDGEPYVKIKGDLLEPKDELHVPAHGYLCEK